jgi:hypothetical protein
MFEQLYDVSETSTVSFVGYISETARYDYAIVYTDCFFGKPLVVCMQTGKSALLCADDIHQFEYLQKLFSLASHKEAKELSLFLSQRIPDMSLQDQY